MPSKVIWIRRLRVLRRLFGSATLASSLMAAFALGIEVLANTRARVHLHRLAVDEPVFEQLPNVEAGVGHRDLACLIWVEPDTTLAAFLDRRRQAFLQFHGHGVSRIQ